MFVNLQLRCLPKRVKGVLTSLKRNSNWQTCTVPDLTMSLTLVNSNRLCQDDVEMYDI